MWCIPCELEGRAPEGKKKKRNDGIAPKDLVLLLVKDMPDFGYTGQSVSVGVEQLQAYSLAFAPTLRAA